MNERQILARITKSAESLSRAARKIVLDMIRNGKPMDEILDALRNMRLPNSEIGKLEQAVKDSMKELADARNRIAHNAGLPEVKSTNITSILAASKMNIPKIRSDVRIAVRRLVFNAIDEEVGVEELERRLKAHNIINAQTLANTSVAGFNNLFTFQQAKEIGVERFKYIGPDGPTIRPFCRRHLGKVYTLKQIEAMDNGQGLPVKSHCGGYNCRHEWIMQV